jgi:hypothetical protein
MTPSPPDESVAKPASTDGGLPKRATLKIAINRIIESGEAIDSEATKRLLAEIVADFGQSTDREAGWNPYADGDPNILVGAKGSLRVKLEDSLTEALAPLGYLRVERLTYRATWSTDDVEQFISFDTYGNPKQFLTADAGLRNAKAEAFAKQCQERYAGEAYFRCMPDGGYIYPPYFCPIHFSIGSLFEWGIRSSLDTLDFSSDELAGKIVDDLGAKFIPSIGAIKSCADLLRFLEKCDRTTPPLLQMGDYYRAAQIAFLSRKLGVARAETQTVLRGFVIGIRNGIDERRFTPETYIEQILDDADATVKQPGR